MEKKYEEVKQTLTDMMKSMTPNEKLPSERELISSLGYSRPTIQKALNELEMEGIIYRKPRMGAFVSDRKLRKSLNKLMSFAEDLAQNGDIAFTKVIAYEIVPANELVSQNLKVALGEDVAHIVRLRHKNGAPIIYDDSYFTLFSIKGITCEDLVTSIYEYIEKTGLVVSMAEEIFSAVIVADDVAALLGIKPKEPVIRIDKVAYLSDERPFEFTISYKNPDKYSLEVKSYRH